MAARIRNELGAEVKLIPGGYGEYTVLVDGEVVATAGRFVIFGVVPPTAKLMRDVAEKLRTPR